MRYHSAEFSVTSTRKIMSNGYSRLAGILLFYAIIFSAYGQTTTLAETPAPITISRSNISIPTPVRIRITLDNQFLLAELEPNIAAREFVALLPLKLALTDYNNTEKISQLPKGLSTTGMPEGFTPAPGDIAFYAPWGNLAIFYKGFSYSKGLIKLGRIQGDISILKSGLKSGVSHNALIELE